ncbi:hypothetical protein OE88DRAFT_1810855 [Heliocybe sulcata]|uniref:Mediator of RNA polymerase II transcription subunit 19 n=1 Tax=Heliocybe sulcata TaxID=5364 RepID=A0A5C3MR19_9AGAM|nr:hypothetical protein OE88DRAFT_1810855 [Heliocybe sulcata]
MDVDEPMPHAASSNAVAGPSNLSDMISQYLPPPGPPRSVHHLTSTQDLLARFRLLPAYDRHVRPFSAMTPPVAPGSTAVSASTPTDKGKGKEKEVNTPAAASTPGGPADGDDDDEKKKRKNYKYLIQGIPGKHSMKKDDYLTTMMQMPPKSRNTMKPFDQQTQRQAFSISLSGLPGWNINNLVEESPQAREDRKKRKEAKKLAKAQQLAAANGQGQTPLPSQPTQAVPVSATQSRGITPRPGVSSVRTATPVANGSRPASVPSAPPRPAPTPKVAAAPTPAPSTPGTDPFIIKRGKKREHEDSVVGPANSQGPGKGSGKTGLPGVRPRPVKKQRTDGAGQARELMPVQQRTPQGV